MHASSTLLRNDSNRAHVEPRQFLKKRRLASTFALEGGAGEGPREMFMIIRSLDCLRMKTMSADDDGVEDDKS
jgi:hypothetical protein